MNSAKPTIHLWLIMASAAILASACASSKRELPTEFAFGAIADCQYCTAPASGAREYALSDDKLTESVAHLNTMDLAYVVHLGDFIDRGFKNFDVLNPIFDQLKVPKYHVLGNHDFSVSDELKKEVPQKMGLASKYYDFEVNGWRFVVLDGNDISFHAYPKGSEAYKNASEYYTENEITSPKWNGAIGSAQSTWLRKVLEKATHDGENTILFCHFPVYPANNHNLWNAEEIISILESYPCVKAYINGHNHKGNYATKEGIHYLTLKAMVNTEETSYAVIKVDEQSISIKGYGREKDRELRINKAE